MRIPKGILILIGGHEHRETDEKPEIAFENEEFKNFEVLKTFLSSIDGHNKRVEIVPTASGIPREVGEMYMRIFNKLGFENVGILDIRDRIDANSYEAISRMKEASAVMFSGGDQFRLSTLLGSSKVMEIIKDKYMHEGFVIAGTSAGAMAMSEVMLYEGHNQEALLKGDVKTSAGLGMISGCIIDTHFVRRGRFGRLIQAVVTNPACVGIGLGEDTALVVRDGNSMQCCGSGMVVIIEGHEIKQTNIADADVNTPVYIEGLKMHILASGTGYLFRERKFLVPAEVQAG